MKSWAKLHLIPILILSALGISIFWPILSDLPNRVLGALNTGNAKDAYQNIWNFWWAGKNCLGFCGNIWHTNFQFFPQGTSLLFETWSYPSLYLFTPLLFLGATAVTAYNLSLIFAVITSLLATYFLAYHLTNKTTASMIAAIVFVLSPYVTGHILDGQLNLVNVQYFPLFLLFLLKSDDEKGHLFKILCGITLLLLGLNDYVYLLFALMVWGIFLLYKFFSNRTILSSLMKRNLIILATFSIPFLLLSSVNIWKMKHFALSGVTKWNAEYSSTNIVSLATPPNFTIVGQKFFGNSYQNYSGIFSDKTMYVGVTVLLLAGLGVIYLKKKKELWLWLGILLSSFILALGPMLQISTLKVSAWLPFGILQYLPILNIIRAPSRFMVLVFLCLAILSGYGVCFIWEHVKSRTATIIILAMALAGLLIEYYPVNAPETDLYMPKGYKMIMEDKSDFSILESPALWMTGLDNSAAYYPIEGLYYQTIHQKKMANGYVTRGTNDLLDSYADTPLLKYLVTSKAQDNLPGALRSNMIRYKETYINNLLYENPYKYLVVVKESAYSILNDNIKLTLEGHIVPFYKDSEIEIYTFK